jgi:NET1-associated nuclear protein 1 (U3 small nucleolar RNA-associated protein 17)
MASALKRKRGPVEVLDTPKRSKSVKSQSGNPLRAASDKVGWEAAFNPPQDLLISTNGINGSHSHGTPESPEAVDYEAYVQDETFKLATEREPPSKQELKEITRRAQIYTPQKKAKELWKVSEPIGGRMINADPVFTTDEKYVARNYYLWNVANSLLQISHCCQSDDSQYLLDLKFPSHSVHKAGHKCGGCSFFNSNHLILSLTDSLKFYMGCFVKWMGFQY